MAWLETAEGERVPMDSSCSLGRCASNHLVLPGDKVSRKHALIHAERDDEFWLSDLGSSNGTYLNSRRLSQSARLFDQDQIAIGPHRLTFRQPTGRKRRGADPTLAEMTLCDSKTQYAWLLLVHLQSPTRVAQSLAPAQITPVLGRWHEECKEVIERHGGGLNKYLADGFLAFWHDRHSGRAEVASALLELKRLRDLAQPPFRLILHYGQVNVNGTPEHGEEQLAGAAVNFVFRAQKLSDAPKGASLVSEVAGVLLQPHLKLTNACKCAVNGFEGEQSFYWF
jgi:pSer/pThr/pTyr-binding forkhead associated (FHA) protein